MYTPLGGYYIYTPHIHIQVICLQPLQGPPPVSRTEDARLKNSEACHVEGETER